MATRKLTKRVVEAIEPGRRDENVWDSQLKGFHVKVTPRGRRVYLLYYRTKDGQERRPVIGVHGDLTCDQARELAVQMKAAVTKGGDPSADKTAARKAISFSDFAVHYLADYAKGRKKASSIRTDRSMLERIILPALGSRKVTTITSDEVQRLHSSLRRTPYQANRVLALLSKMFHLAEHWGIRSTGGNPCRFVEKYPEEKRNRYLSDDELARLGDILVDAEAKKIEPAAAIAAIRLLLLTGCRLNEVLTLRWSHVDWERAQIVFPDTKTGAQRRVVGQSVLDYLRALPWRRGDSDGWVIPGRQNDSHLVNLEKAWRRIRERIAVGQWRESDDKRISDLVARIEGELKREASALECSTAAREAKIELSPGFADVRLHDLRHTHASAAAGLGMSLPMIGKLLGHTQSQTTARYAHLAADPSREAANQVSATLQARLLGEKPDATAKTAR